MQALWSGPAPVAWSHSLASSGQGYEFTPPLFLPFLFLLFLFFLISYILQMVSITHNIGK